MLTYQKHLASFVGVHIASFFFFAFFAFLVLLFLQIIVFNSIFYSLYVVGLSYQFPRFANSFWNLVFMNCPSVYMM